jgi:hypothetical protein
VKPNDLFQSARRLGLHGLHNIYSTPSLCAGT